MQEITVSVASLKCVGGPYDGRTIDVNDRLLVGDVPIDIIVRKDDASRDSKKIGEYRVRVVDGRQVLSWFDTPSP